MQNKIHPVILEIKNFLKENEISEYEIAKLAGISRSTVGRILSGENSPSLDNLEALVNVIGGCIYIKKTARKANLRK